MFDLAFESQRSLLRSTHIFWPEFRRIRILRDKLRFEHKRDQLRFVRRPIRYSSSLHHIPNDKNESRIELEIEIGSESRLRQHVRSKSTTT